MLATRIQLFNLIISLFHLVILLHIRWHPRSWKTRSKGVIVIGTSFSWENISATLLLWNRRPPLRRKCISRWQASVRQLLGPEGGPGSLQVGLLPESKPSSSSTPGCLATVRLWLVFNRTFSPLSPSLRRELNLQLVTSGDPRPIVTSRTLLIRALKFKQDH